MGKNMERKDTLKINVVQLQSVDSTNLYLQQQRHNLPKPTLVITPHQTHGVGQRGSSWFSLSGDLTCSYLVAPKNLKAKEFFLLNQIASLAIIRTLKSLGLQPTVKWPNDIMLNDEKLAGILIETHTQGHLIPEAIIGIGVNVAPRAPHQCDFSPRATSLGHHGINPYPKPHDLALKIYAHISTLSEFINTEKGHSITEEYHENLFRSEGLHPFRAKDGSQFIARIIHVDADGILHLEMENSKRATFHFKEVQHIF